MHIPASNMWLWCWFFFEDFVVFIFAFVCRLLLCMLFLQNNFWHFMQKKSLLFSVSHFAINKKMSYYIRMFKVIFFDFHSKAWIYYLEFSHFVKWVYSTCLCTKVLFHSSIPVLDCNVELNVVKGLSLLSLRQVHFNIKSLHLTNTQISLPNICIEALSVLFRYF